MPSFAPASRPKILFVAPADGIPFIEQDRETLCQEFDVVFLSRADLPRQELFSRVREELKRGGYALVYVWFVEPYDTPQILWEARRAAVPSAVVVGGYETVWYPEHGYGALSSWRNRMKMHVSYRLAGLILPTSQVLYDEVARFSPSVAAKMLVVQPGIDSEYFCPASAARQELVVTVGRMTPFQWRVKGLDVFARASKLLPGVRFEILGPGTEPELRDRLLDMGGPNLEVQGEQLTSEQLRQRYREARVYAQLSMRESFGVALAEAMACGCVPVVSDAGALPEVAGGTGCVVPYGNADRAARAIEVSLKSSGVAARARVVEQYPPAARVDKLRESLGGRLGIRFEVAA